MKVQAKSSFNKTIRLSVDEALEVKAESWSKPFDEKYKSKVLSYLPDAQFREVKEDKKVQVEVEEKQVGSKKSKKEKGG